VRIADERGADIVVDNMIEVDEQGQRIGDALFLRSPSFAQARDINLCDWVNFNLPLKPGDCLGYLKPIFRRDTLTRLDLRYDPALRNSEDYFLVAYLLAAGARMRYTPEAGYSYQRSSASTSHRLSPKQTQAWLDAEASFRKRFAGTLTPAETAALDARGRVLREVNQFVAAIDLMKAKRFGSFAGLLASDPASAVNTIAFFGRIAIGKVTGRPAFQND
jgi:succinoglycan biosynthesis protein ExoO